jgi:hypothetical protein
VLRGQAVAMEIARPNRMHTESPARSLSAVARLAAALEIFLGIGALLGGGLLSVAPDGHLLGMTTKTLAGTPFHTYLVPGIILFTCIGVAPIFAAVITLRRMAIAPVVSIAVGTVLIGWISVEMVMLAGPGSLAWAFYLALGACIATLGAAWWRGTLR